MGVALFLPDGLSLVLQPEPRTRSGEEDRVDWEKGSSAVHGRRELNRSFAFYLVSNIDCTSFSQGDSVINISSSGYDNLGAGGSRSSMRVDQRPPAVDPPTATIVSAFPTRPIHSMYSSLGPLQRPMPTSPLPSGSITSPSSTTPAQSELPTASFAPTLATASRSLRPTTAENQESSSWKTDARSRTSQSCPPYSGEGGNGEVGREGSSLRLVPEGSAVGPGQSHRRSSSHIPNQDPVNLFPDTFRGRLFGGIDQNQRRVMDSFTRLFHHQAAYTDTVQLGFRSLIDSFNAEAKNVEARHVAERDKLVREITAAKAAAEALVGERDTARAEVALITSQTSGQIKKLEAALVGANQRLAAGQDAAARATAERDQTLATLRADFASLASAKDGLQDLLIGSQQRETELSGNVEVLQAKVATVEDERDAAKSTERELRGLLRGYVEATDNLRGAAEPYLAVKTALSESASPAVELATDSHESPSNLFAELERRIKEMATEDLIHDDSSDEDEASPVPEGQVHPFSSLPPLPPLPPCPQRAEGAQHNGSNAHVGHCTPSVGHERIIKDASPPSPPSSPCPTTPGHRSLKRPSSRTSEGDGQSDYSSSKRARVDLAGLGARDEKG